MIWMIGVAVVFFLFVFFIGVIESADVLRDMSRREWFVWLLVGTVQICGGIVVIIGLALLGMFFAAKEIGLI